MFERGKEILKAQETTATKPEYVIEEEEGVHVVYSRIWREYINQEGGYEVKNYVASSESREDAERFMAIAQSATRIGE